MLIRKGALAGIVVKIFLRFPKVSAVQEHSMSVISILLAVQG